MTAYLIPVTADGGFSQTPITGEPAIEFATEAYVGTAISNLVDTAPTTLNTLNELAAALNDDENFASTVTTALGNKADTSSLAAVATSGSYTDLSNKPTIPTNTNELTNGAGFLVSSDISGKQNTLVSGTDIKTINGTSLLGSGDLTISSGSTFDGTLTLAGTSGSTVTSTDGTSIFDAMGWTRIGNSPSTFSWDQPNKIYFAFNGSSEALALKNALLGLTAGAVFDFTFNHQTGAGSYLQHTFSGITFSSAVDSGGGNIIVTVVENLYTLLQAYFDSGAASPTVDVIYTAQIMPNRVMAVTTTGTPDKVWTFTNDGVLTLPSGGDVVNSTGTSVLGVTSYNDLTDKPALFSGSYTDLTSKPTLITSYNDLTDKPALFSGSYTDLTSKPTIPTNYFKGLQILEDVYEASGAANIIFSSTDNSVTITRNFNNIDFAVAGGGSGSSLPDIATANGNVLGFDGSNNLQWRYLTPSDLQVSNNSIGTQGSYDHFLVWDHTSTAWNIESSPVVCDRIFSGQVQSIKIGTTDSAITTSNTDPGSIVLTTQNNASYTNSSYARGFYVDPVRNDDTPTQMLYYNTTTKEISYGAASGGVSLPSQTGNSGKFLTTNGSTLSWATVSSGTGTSAFADTFKFDLQTDVSGMSTIFTLPASAGASSYFLVNAYIPGQMGMVPYVVNISPQLSGSWSPVSVSGSGSGNYFISSTAPSGLQAASFSDTHNGSVYFTIFQITSEERSMSLYAGVAGTNAVGGNINIISEPTYNAGLPWMTYGNFYGRIYGNGGPEMWSQLSSFVPANGVESYVDETNMYVWVKVPGTMWSQGGGAGTTIGTITTTGYFSGTIQGNYFGN